MSKIQYSGLAAMTESGLEIMAFHLHRFLAGWMEAYQQERLFITLGFEGAQCEAATFMIELHQSRALDVGWSFDDLCQTYRQGDGNLYLEHADEDATTVLRTFPILDRPATGGQARVAIGFVLMPQHEESLDSEHLVALQNRVFEAICAARRNAMRLFFDEHRDHEIKGLLYAFMDHLPEWTGCDYSASMILTSSLETMTLDSSSRAHFNILAEKLYGHRTGILPERLVGMMVRMNEGEAQHVLSAAFHRQREDADLPYQCFMKRDGKWESQDSGQRYSAIHAVKGREEESMMVLTPLVAMDGQDRELLGFLSITWKSGAELTSSAGDLLSEIGSYVGPLLRHSSLYMLGAKKLWILREMRASAEALLANEAQDLSQEELIGGFIGEAAELLREHVAVPSFGLAYLKHCERGRVLRFEHPHGWAINEGIDLVVDVEPEARIDSGVSSLAVRLNRPLVLAGGYGEGDDFGFKNSLFVHEETGRLEDVRRGNIGDKGEPGEWVALSAYYKPARKHAYATLAYPITFAKKPLGVLTIEVDKETDWLWWTGFGGHLFWQLFASELASVFFALGVRAEQ